MPMRCRAASSSLRSCCSICVRKTGTSLPFRSVMDRRREFRFSLVRANLSNAYALPGGFVFITELLLDLCAEDRDELAFPICDGPPPRVSLQPGPRQLIECLCAAGRLRLHYGAAARSVCGRPGRACLSDL